MLRNKNNVEIKYLDLQHFKTGFEFEVDYLKKYVDRLADPVNELVDTLEAEVASDLDSDPNAAENIGDEYFAEASKLKGYFYNSLIVLTHTIYESSLQKLCQQLKSKTNSQLCYSQLRNNDTTAKLLLYIKLLTGVCGKADNGSYGRLKQFQGLRNKIAHQNSQVHASSDEDRRTQLTTMMEVFNRGVLEGDDSKLTVNFETGDFAINSASLVVEFVELVESNILYIHEKLTETEFSVETTI
nr:hypothetical protein [Moritella viscosa]SHN95967.1 Putative uncharacterized protein [Moritella viscosa]